VVLRWCGRRAGGLGPGLTSYSADAAWGCPAKRSVGRVPGFLAPTGAAGLICLAWARGRGSRWAGPSGPLDQYRRWADARRLLHEKAYPAADRVAGLLILLYAQKLSAITALTARHVLHEDGRTLLRLGSRPIILPAPLDALVAGLAAGRRPPGSSLLGVPSPWLFPGRQPGSALTKDALAQRLHARGISPRQGRSTALFTLAADVPAAILAKTLGIHVQAAIQWQKISAGDWAAYAADVSRRTTPQPIPSRHEAKDQA
jgi:hypothetical protein